MKITEHYFKSSRHETFYLAAGNLDEQIIENCAEDSEPVGFCMLPSHLFYCMKDDSGCCRIKREIHRNVMPK